MNRSFLMMSGVSKEGRPQVTSTVSVTSSATGGWVISHTLFSNIAITIQFSLPEQKLGEFQDHAIAAGVRLDNDSLAKIRKVIERNAPRTAEFTTSLNITFMHNEPDLRQEIPAAPG